MSTPTLTEQLTDQLVLVARQIEDHKTAIWLLEHRQLTLRAELAASGWTPPSPESGVST